MNDESSQGKDGTPGPVAGERLAEARQLRQLSLLDVARKLHLDEPRVQALEENRFDALGAPVFAKGYLRKYADLVGVSIDDVMADYYTMNRSVGAPPVVGPVRRRPPRELHLGRWFSILVLAGVLGAIAWWWVNRPPAPVTGELSGSRQLVPKRSQPAEVAEPADDSTNDIDDTDITDDAGDEPAPGAADGTPAPRRTGNERPATQERAAVAPRTAPPETAPPETAPQVPVPAASRPAVAGGMLAGGDTELRLTFSGDCWTEVSDASGRRLFFDLGTDGRTVTVSGRAPLRVLVGNDDNVALSVNGRPYALTGAERRGNTARYTINQ